MPSINMIAARRTDKRRQEKNIRRLVYAIAAEFGVTLVIVSVMVGRLVSTNGRVSDLQTEIAKLQPTVTKIQQLQKDTQAMQPKVATLVGAKADTLFWYNGFYAVTSCLPEKAWLTTIGTNGGGDGSPGSAGAGDPQLSVSGVALDQSQVGATILRMNQSPSLDHVDLAAVTQQKTGQTDTVSFQMTIHLKPETPPADPNKPASDKGGSVNVQKS